MTRQRTTLFQRLVQRSFQSKMLERLRLFLTLKIEFRAIAKLNTERESFTETADTLLDWRRTLSRKLPLDRQGYTGNLWYGTGYVLSRQAGTSQPFPGYIEHGLYLGNYVNPREVHGQVHPRVVTLSQYRAEMIHAVAPAARVSAVGPYIHYAQWPISSTSFAEQKQRLGRVLLVFPSHSEDAIRASFDQHELIERIHTLAREQRIDTTVVCMYFRDLESGASPTPEAPRIVLRVIAVGKPKTTNAETN